MHGRTVQAACVCAYTVIVSCRYALTDNHATVWRLLKEFLETGAELLLLSRHPFQFIYNGSLGHDGFAAAKPVCHSLTGATAGLGDARHAAAGQAAPDFISLLLTNCHVLSIFVKSFRLQCKDNLNVRYIFSN